MNYIGYSKITLTCIAFINVISEAEIHFFVTVLLNVAFKAIIKTKQSMKSRHDFFIKINKNVFKTLLSKIMFQLFLSTVNDA